MDVAPLIGIRGRNGDTFHEELMGTIDRCNKEGQELTGGKIDVRKCFDTVAPEQGIALWEEWKAPRGVTRVFYAFYRQHRRWVDYMASCCATTTPAQKIIVTGMPGLATVTGRSHDGMGGNNARKGPRGGLRYLPG